MSDLRSDAREWAATKPAGDNGRVFALWLCDYLDIVEEDWHSAERRANKLDAELAALRSRNEELEAALKGALAELEWGNEEMRGRPPQHWLDAIEATRAVLREEGK